MDIVTCGDAVYIAAAARADVEQARAALRLAAQVDWVSDQADAYRAELYAALTGLYGLEERIDAACAALTALVPGQGSLA